MPYSEVGEVSPTAARLSWNTQFQALYGQVEAVEDVGRPWLQRLEADVTTSSMNHQDTDLGFDVAETDDFREFMFRAHIIWTTSAGANEGIGIGVASSTGNGGSSYNARRPIENAWERDVQNSTVNDSEPPDAGHPGTYPQPSIAILMGMIRMADMGAGGRVWVTFRSALGSPVTMKAGSTLEVHSVGGSFGCPASLTLDEAALWSISGISGCSLGDID